MSSKKSIERKNVAILKDVIRHIADTKISEKTVDELASKAIRKTPVIDIISEIRLTRNLPEHYRNDILLPRFIEMLAIVNSIIDFQLKTLSTKSRGINYSNQR